MRLLRFIPIKLTILLVFGIVIGKHFDTGVLIPLSVAISSLAILGILFYISDSTKLKTPKTTDNGYGLAMSTTVIALGVLAFALAKPGKQLRSLFES